MIKTLRYSASALTLLSLQTAQTNIEIDFVESAPKDRFVINNVGQCILENLELEMDLSESTGGLIFDTTACAVQG